MSYKHTRAASGNTKELGSDWRSVTHVALQWGPPDPRLWTERTTENTKTHVKQGLGQKMLNIPQPLFLAQKVNLKRRSFPETKATFSLDAGREGETETSAMRKVKGIFPLANLDFTETWWSPGKLGARDLQG